MYYVDNFENKLVTQRSFYSAPERYYQYKPSSDDLFHETWLGENDKELIVSYDKEELDCDLVNDIRQQYFDTSDFVPSCLLAFELPNHLYEESINQLD